MWQALKKINDANKQTKYFILMFLIYIVALAWSTLQSFARLEYSPTGESKPIVIQQPSQNEQRN
jgi:hypothetical protein